jgi:MoxR-like ATPase
MKYIQEKVLSDIKNKISEIKKEIHKGIVGQEEVIDSVIKCLICNSHALLEGVPGIAKTLLIRCLSKTIKGAGFSRIQFTPDLLPSDITGVEIYQKGKGFSISYGPIFGNIVTADEINRAPPKVQSAMLQCMQEREVTIGRQTFSLPKPFFVLATQNPLETMGVYPLPEAQTDRFLFKIKVDYPEREAEKKIILNNIDVMDISDFKIKKIINTKDLLKYQTLLHKVYISDEIKRYIYGFVEATRNPKKYSIESGKYIRWGGSPRASIFLGLASKSNALINGRDYVIPEDVQEIAKNVLRHRIILNYEGKAKNISTDEIIEEILDKVEII